MLNQSINVTNSVTEALSVCRLSVVLCYVMLIAEPYFDCEFC